MNRKEQLANIYIKIYNKRSLTMEDLTFLAKFDPECFAKTCQNLVYNIPETKELLKPEQKQEEQPGSLKEQKTEGKPEHPVQQNTQEAARTAAETETSAGKKEATVAEEETSAGERETTVPKDSVYKEEERATGLAKVEFLLKNLKKMEMRELPVKEVSMERVRDLLGSLYMEMLFPHNDRTRYFEMEEEQEEPRFNKKV